NSSETESTRPEPKEQAWRHEPSMRKCRDSQVYYCSIGHSCVCEAYFRVEYHERVPCHDPGAWKRHARPPAHFEHDLIAEGRPRSRAPRVPVVDVVSGTG